MSSTGSRDKHNETVEDILSNLGIEASEHFLSFNLCDLKVEFYLESTNQKYRTLCLSLVRCPLTIETETEIEFIAKFKKMEKIIYNSMIVMNLAKEPGEASL